MDSKRIHDLFIKVGYDDAFEYDTIDDFVAEKLCINTYTRVQKSKTGEVYWRPYIEPYNWTGGLEFNYVYKNRWNALWAALVAAVVWRLNRKIPADEVLDIIMGEWRECNLKPDFKITPQPKINKEDLNKMTSDPKFQDLFGQLFGGSTKNPFSDFGL